MELDDLSPGQWIIITRGRVTKHADHTHEDPTYTGNLLEVVGINLPFIIGRIHAVGGALPVLLRVDGVEFVPLRTDFVTLAQALLTERRATAPDEITAHLHALLTGTPTPPIIDLAMIRAEVRKAIEEWSMEDDDDDDNGHEVRH